MKHLDLEIFNDFSCIGSACPFTCCSGWTIYVDPVTTNYYKSVPGAFGERLSCSINSEPGKGSTFIRTPDGDCPFLNKEKLCDIYINIGEENLCYTCKTYPRYHFVAGDISFSGVSISCPEVARFYLSHTQPLKIDYTEDNIPAPNEVKTDWALFNHSISAFTTCIAIAQNRSLTISERIASLILFISEFQSQVNNNEDPSELIQFFSDPLSYPEILKDSCIYNTDLECKVDFGFELLSFFQKAEQFETMLPEIHELYKYYSVPENTTIKYAQVQNACDILKSPEEQLWQEQLLTYGLYRYFMQGFDNHDFYEKFLIPLVLVFLFSTHIMILQYIKQGTMPDFNSKLLIIARSSRVTEHSSDCCKLGLDNFRKKGYLELMSLFKIIS